MAYQGFQNQATWLVHRWLTQDERTDSQLRVLATNANYQAQAFAKEIEALVTDFDNPLAGHNSLYTDILNRTFEEVAWEEIAEKFLD